MSLADFKYADIIHRCFRCGYCKFPVPWEDVNNCPPYSPFAWKATHMAGDFGLPGRGSTTRLSGQSTWRKFFTPATCKNCVIKCPLRFNVDIVNMVIAARGEMVESGRLPSVVKRFLENVELWKPLWGIKTRRGEWAERTGVEKYHGQEYLLYVGCTGSYDSRAQKAARALAEVQV